MIARSFGLSGERNRSNTIPDAKAASVRASTPGINRLILASPPPEGGGGGDVGGPPPPSRSRPRLFALAHHALPELFIAGKAVQQLLHPELLGRGAALVAAQLPQPPLQLGTLALRGRRHLAVPGEEALPLPRQLLQPVVQLTHEVPVAHACKDTHPARSPCDPAPGEGRIPRWPTPSPGSPPFIASWPRSSSSRRASATAQRPCERRGARFWPKPDGVWRRGSRRLRRPRRWRRRGRCRPAAGRPGPPKGSQRPGG